MGSEKKKSFKWQVSSMVDKVRRGVAKTIQAAAEGDIFDTLPDCDILAACDRIAIKVVSYDRDKPTSSDFAPVQFVVKEKKGGRRTIFNAEMVPAQGIVVRTLRGVPVMEVRLPDNSQTSMGKIAHPIGSTLYKIEFTKAHSFGNEWMIRKLNEPFINFVNTPVSEILGTLKSFLLSIYCINGDQSLEFFKLNNDKIGCLRPSYFSMEQSVVIQFDDKSTVQERAAILGTSLLFFVVTVRPEYGAMLQNTMC